MAGLSMGGGQTLQITMKHLDQFAYIGAFSGVGGIGGAAFDVKTAFDGAMADTAAFNHRVKLLWLGIGTVEPERHDEQRQSIQGRSRQGRNQARVFRVAGHGSRMADLAPRPRSVCADVVPLVAT